MSRAHPDRKTSFVLVVLLSGLLAPSASAEDSLLGVTVRVYELGAAPLRLPTLAPNQTPNIDEVQPSIALRENADFGNATGPTFTEITGSIEVDIAGPYRFRLTSDDGSRCTLDGNVLIEHDGRHGATSKSSGMLVLAVGAHPVRLEHFDAGGKRMLLLEWMPPGAAEFVPIPTQQLRTEAVPARVVSPGPKRLLDARRPGDGCPVVGVHPSFTLQHIRPEGFEPKVGAMTFLPDGRLVIGTFDPLQRDEVQLPDIESKASDRLLAIEGLTSGDPADVRISTLAEGVYEPSGLCAVGDALYVSHRKAITRLTDRDGDGYFETHEDVASGWEAWNYHQFTFGLVHVPDPDVPERSGTLYATLSTAMAPPAWEGMGTNAAPNGLLRGGILEVDLTSRTSRIIAGGTRTPNGIGIGPEGTLFYCDNQGTWMPASQLAEVVPGRFYGHFNNTNVVPKLAERFPLGGFASIFCDRPRAPAAVFLPQGECSNSPSQPILMERGPYAGQMLVGDITAGGLRRLALERVDGVWQGAAFQCTQGLEVGVNRLAWGPDGSLYAGGIGAGGNWNYNGTQFGLERLVPNDHVTFEMYAMRVTEEGFEITFTKPVDRAWLADPSHYELRSWSYRPTKDYGGPKIDERNLQVRAARASDDGRVVHLEIDGREVNTCVHLRCDPTAADGERIWSTDAWYTLQRIPVDRRAATIDGRPVTVRDAGLGAVPGEFAALLIDRGADTMLVNAADPGTVPSTARTQAELLQRDGTLEVGAGEGFLTRITHRACRLHVEWQSSDGDATLRLMDRFELALTNSDDQHDANRWHAADIWFKPVMNKAAVVTVLVDGDFTLVEHALLSDDPKDATMEAGPLRLPGRATTTRFRNLWIEPLDRVRWAAGPWQPIWEGDSLNGWEPRGGVAEYRADEGMIVGTTTPNTPNTFLVSERTYRDFELLVDVQQDVELNSGIQIRSHIEGGFANRDGRMVGYQVELDPSERGYTAGLYDEARRGWLFPLINAPYAHAAYRPSEWNHLRVVAQGDVIRTWINGVPAAVVFDAADREGHLGLQVHGVGDRARPMEVRWRRLALRELTPVEP